MDQEHPIRVVARRTGLTAHVIRIWEKRYKAVVPRRSKTNRRFYTTEDIERFLLLKRATILGRSIGQVAKLSTEDLLELLRSDEQSAPFASKPSFVAASPERTLEDHKKACVAAIETLDSLALEEALLRASVSMSRPVFLETFLVELMRHIGDCWQSGTLRVMHEHLVSALVRTIVGGMGSGYELSSYAPVMIVTTPTGQLHELGGLIVAATSSYMGWRAMYLGPNLPAEEIAFAATRNKARVVALSIIYPSDDIRVNLELEKLRQSIGDQADIIVGGGAVDGYRGSLEKISAIAVPSIGDFRSRLEELRSPAHGS